MPTRMKSKPPSAEQMAARNDMIAVLTKHNHLDAMELLAVAAHLVGQLIALQDQTKITGTMAMDLVGTNIEAGNREAMAGLMKPEGQA